MFGQIDEIGDLFGKAGLGAIAAVVLALTKAVGRHVAQPVEARDEGPHGSQIQGVEEIWPRLIVGDEDLAPGLWKIFVEVDGAGRPAIAKDYRITRSC